MTTSNENHQDNEQDFAALLAEFEQESQGAPQRRQPRVGQTVRGRILSIGADAAFIDLGAKSDGMIELGELRDDEGRVTVAVGDVIEGRVVEMGGPAGCIVLKRKLGRGPDAKAELEQAHRLGLPVEGVVSGVNKGGVEVQMAGVRAFCPISQLDLGHVEDATPFVGRKLAFRITRYETTRRDANIVLSRRELLAEEARQKASELRAQLAVGSILHGRITSLKDYGAFVDLGGLEGMLHVSQIGFARVTRPQDVLSVGQEVEVQVIKLEKTDDPKRPERIALSLKSLAHDPWEDARRRYGEGTSHTGKVVRLEAFGAFVELEPGIEGLIHVSELAPGKLVRHAREAVKLGDALAVTVLAVDGERRRISLGLASANEPSEPLTLEHAPRSLGTLGDLLRGKTTAATKKP